ncbi:hypothetical protein BD413DRAFT_100151 [Trametes elegans]|nr:hypothetical protein BD413DRAFT_100151 [Trametes elegans]
MHCVRRSMWQTCKDAHTSRSEGVQTPSNTAECIPQHAHRLTDHFVASRPARHWQAASPQALPLSACRTHHQSSRGHLDTPALGRDTARKSWSSMAAAAVAIPATRAAPTHRCMPAAHSIRNMGTARRRCVRCARQRRARTGKSGRLPRGSGVMWAFCCVSARSACDRSHPLHGMHEPRRIREAAVLLEGREI